MDALQWMGAVRMRVQTAHSNPHHSSQSVNILRRQKLHVCKKQIHQDIEKSGLVWIRRENCTDRTVYKSKQSKTALNKYVAGYWCERQDMDFFTGGSVIMDYGLMF